MQAVKTQQNRKQCNKKNSTKEIKLLSVAESREVKHQSNSKAITHALFVHLFKFAGHEISTSEVTTRFCTKFSKYLIKNVKAASARTYLQKLSAILATCVGKHYLPFNPMPPMKSLLPRRKWQEPSYLTAEEIRIMAAADCPALSTKRAFLFACYTGLRISDIETLTWSMIHLWSNNAMIIKTQKKTGREVQVPLCQSACDILRQIGYRKHGPVFKLRSRSSICNDIKCWARNAGIKKHITFHSSRHSFATLLVSGNVDINTISKLCGHSNTRITERYTHITHKRLQEGIQVIENLLAMVVADCRNIMPPPLTPPQLNALTIKDKRSDITTSLQPPNDENQNHILPL